MDIEITIEGPTPRELGEKLHRAVRAGSERAVRVTTESAERAAKADAPRASGALIDSIHAVPGRASTNQVAGSVVVSAKHASFVQDGTPPHVIEARKARALHWEDASGERFATRVSHPGTKPNPFLDRTKETAQRVLDDAMDRVVAEAIAKVT